MPKKIPITQMREWLDSYERGKSEASIAKAAKRDVRTIKRGIEQTRRERDAQTAKAELLKDALRNHQHDLMNIIGGILLALELPTLDLSLPRELRNDSPTRLPGAIAHYRHLQQRCAVVFESEESTLWELLQEHLRRDPMWKALDQWKKAMEEHICSRIVLKAKIPLLLKQKTDLKLIESSSEQGLYLNLRVAMPRLYEVTLRDALGIQYGDDPERAITANVEDGTVRWSNAPMAIVPGKEVECRKNILEVVEDLKSSAKANDIATTYRRVNDATAEARKVVEEIKLLGFIPGQCRVCKRMGIYI